MKLVEQEVKRIDPKSLISCIEKMLLKAQRGEIVEAVIIAKTADGRATMTASGSYSVHEVAGLFLDAAVTRLGYKLR